MSRRKRPCYFGLLPYPRYIVNEKDDSILVLITEATDQPSDQPRPKRFLNENTNKEYLVYMDVTETTNDQYVKFLNASGGNRVVGGSPWIKLDPGYRDIHEVTPGRFALTEERLGKYAVIDVNWFGAKAFCQWAGKELPQQEEWTIAARPAGDGSYPWGKEFNGKFCRSGLSDEKLHNGRCGHFPQDRSRIGCFDMAGNVAEWCDDYYAEPKGERVVCGGSFNDKDVEVFNVTSRRGLAQVAHNRWVGFRGVVRVPVDKLDP